MINSQEKALIFNSLGWAKIKNYGHTTRCIGKTPTKAPIAFISLRTPAAKLWLPSIK